MTEAQAQKSRGSASKAKSREEASLPPHIVGPSEGLGKRPPPKERILMAAESIFGEKGYASVSVEDVLNLADVSRATFYQYFGSKEVLAAALFDRALDVLTASVLARFATEASIVGKIAAGLDVYLELWQRHGRLVQELSIEALRPGSKLAPARKRVVDTVVNVMCETALAETGKSFDPVVCEHLILGTEAVLVHRCLNDGLSDEARRELREKLLPLMLSAVGLG